MTRWRSICALAAALLLSLAALPSLASGRVALVIGNASYAHAPGLANPLNDARDVGAALERLGFAVTRLENAGQASMRRALQDFARAASTSEIAAVFYAGHGIEVDQSNFLVPVDARLLNDADVEFETVPLELVSRAVERARGLRLVILDACRENPFAASMQRAGATRSIGRGLARVEPSGETLVAYAAKEGTVASDGEGRNSPYSGALLKHLEEPGLEVGLMFRKVRDAVLADTGGSQEPFVYGSLSSRGAYLTARPAPKPPARPSVTASPRMAADREHLFWDSVKDSRDPADLEAYLERYPDGTYETLARNRLKWLQGGPEGAGTPAGEKNADAAGPGKASVSARVEAERLATEREFWASVKTTGDPEELQAYLDRYPAGSYAALAHARLKRLEGPTQVKADPAGATVASAASVPAQGPEAVEAALDLGRSYRRSIQMGLSSLGFDPGPADGLFGGKTRAALEAWQAAKGEASTGWLTGAEAEVLKAAGAEALLLEDERKRKARAAAEAHRKAEAEKKARQRQAETKPERVFKDCEACPEMVVVPADSFTMGSPASEEGREHYEGPQHRVRISQAFAVGKYEVTFAEWEACVDGGGCNRHLPDDEGWGRGRRPVIDVSWDDAQAYVLWLSRKTGKQYRLLTEAEWEYAARAGTTGPFHFGETISTDRANYNGNFTYGSGRKGVYREKTVPAGSFPGNDFGLHDMHGNAWEWVEDCWHASYSGAPSDGSAWTTGGDCSRRVLRGGSWSSRPEYLRSTDRVGSSPGYRFSNGGFRVSRTLSP